MFSRARKTIPILAYHAILLDQPFAVPDEWSKPHAVTRAAFRRQLQYLRANEWRSILPAAMTTLSKAAPVKYCALTFDDGHKSDLLAAAEMQRVGYRGIFYVPWAHCGREGFLSPADIRALLRDGFAIGSHGLTHEPFTGKADQDLQSELFESKQRLQELTGYAIEDLALPYGRYDQRVIRLCRAAGYTRVMSSNIGLARLPDTSPLPRLPVTARTSFDDYRAMLSAGRVRTIRHRLARALSRRLRRLENLDPRSAESS